jgi:hypothetical protein
MAVTSKRTDIKAGINAAATGNIAAAIMSIDVTVVRWCCVGSS